MYLKNQKIPLHISKSILTIGPDYLNYSGGIGAVIYVYSKYFPCFNFLLSYRSGSTYLKIFIYLKCIFNLFKILTFDRKIKIIHIHGASRGSFARKFIYFLIAKYFYRKKVIYHIHGGEFHLFYLHSNIIVKKLICLFINNSDVIVCLSEFWKSFFESNFNPKRIQIIPNIIDFPSKTNLNKVSSFCTFLFLGQIGFNKGVFDLLEVISINKNKYNGKIKLVVGGNGEVQKLKFLIKKLQLSELVEFVGWISNEEKIFIFQNSDIFILPSYNEGLPISILEALSYGKAIISTNVGGIPEIVIPGRNGILIEPGNLLDIEKAIDFFILDANKIKSFGKESKIIVTKHLPDAVVMDLSIIYTLLLNE
jgi:glycosyltransferase involved in cell wall biosynthesis